MWNWTGIYIGVLYAGAVVLARRCGVDLPKKVALLLYALVLVFFFKPLTQHYVNAHDDFLGTLPPWTFTAQVKDAINDEMNDIPLQQTAWGIQVRESWRSFHAPLWNAYAGSGYPLLANGQSQALSPIRLLALPVPTTFFMAAEAAMKILVALTFAFLFCRGRGYSELASVAGATVFGFAGFLHTWLHFALATAACFAPAVLYLIDRIAERRTSGRFVSAAFVWAAILFAGHPETASHIFFLALIYVLWIVFVEKRASPRIFVTLGGAMVVAAMLSAPFLLPFLEALPRSLRYAEIQTNPLVVEGQAHTDFHSMVVAFQAHYFGRVPFEKAWGPASAETVAGFSGVLGIAACFGLLAHIIRRRAWRSTEAFFVIATGIVVGVIAGWPLLGDVIHAVLPVVAHARFRLLLVLLLGVQAAAAIDLTQRGERTPFVAGCAVAAAMLIALLALVVHPDVHYRTVSIVTATRSMAVLALAALFAFVPRKPVLLALLVAVIFELGSVTRGWNPPLPADLMYPRTPIIARLGELRAAAPKDAPFRVAGVGPMLFPNTSAVFGIEDIRVHDPMAYDRYMGFLRLTAGYKAGGESYFAWFDRSSATVLDHLNVRYLIQDPNSPDPDPARWTRIFRSIEGSIYENTRFLPRFYAVRNVIVESRVGEFLRLLRTHEDWSHTALLEDPKFESEPRSDDTELAVVRITSAEPAAYRVHVSAPRRTLVVSSIPWWPGWNVVRNGKPVDPIRANGTFVGFAVPPGESDVQVMYSPRTWWAGCAFAFVGLLLLAGISHTRAIVIRAA